MANQVKLRRGTSAEHSTFTGALAELTVDTTNKRLILHDSSTVGGIPLATQADISGATLDSAVVKGLIDSNYITSLGTPNFETASLVGNYLILGLNNGSSVSVNMASLATGGITVLDSADVIGLIDSAHVNLRVDYDSSSTIGLINDTVDASFVNSLVNILDSADVTSIIDSSYINSRVSSTDSASVVTIINDTVDATFVNSLVNILDSADVNSVINSTVNSSFVNSLVNILDSSDVTAIAQANDTRFDSAGIMSIIDSDFGTRTTSELTEGANLYYTSNRVDSDIRSSVLSGITTNTISYVDNVYHMTLTTSSASTDELLVASSTIQPHMGSEYLIKLANTMSGTSQATKILATFDGSSVGYVEYGTIFTGDSDFGEFVVRESSGDLCVFYTPRNSNTISITSFSTIIA